MGDLVSNRTRPSSPGRRLGSERQGALHHAPQDERVRRVRRDGEECPLLALAPERDAPLEEAGVSERRESHARLVGPPEKAVGAEAPSSAVERAAGPQPRLGRVGQPLLELVEEAADRVRLAG